MTVFARESARANAGTNALWEGLVAIQSARDCETEFAVSTQMVHPLRVIAIVSEAIDHISGAEGSFIESYLEVCVRVYHDEIPVSSRLAYTFSTSTGGLACLTANTDIGSLPDIRRSS
jgi:hypothetical protein